MQHGRVFSHRKTITALWSPARRARRDRRPSRSGVLAADMGDTLGLALAVERKGWRCDRKRIVSGTIRGRRRRLGGRRQQRKDGEGRGGRFMVVLLAEKGRRRRDRRRNGRGATRGRLIRPQRCSPAVLSPVRRTWAGMWPCCVPRRRLAAAGSSTGRPRCCSTRVHFFYFFVVVRADEKT